MDQNINQQQVNKEWKLNKKKFWIMFILLNLLTWTLTIILALYLLYFDIDRYGVYTSLLAYGWIGLSFVAAISIIVLILISYLIAKKYNKPKILYVTLIALFIIGVLVTSGQASLYLLGF